MVYYTKINLMEVGDLPTSKLSRKRNKIEVEGIIKGLVIWNSFLGVTKFFAFLTNEQKPILPIYGRTDGLIQAKSKVSMLKFSSETETPVKVRGILKLPNFITSYITGPDDQKKYLLECETIKLENWESILWSN